MPIRVIFADVRGILRDSLKLLLEKSGIVVVGEAESFAQAADLARSLRPQAVITDVSMPLMNGLEGAAEIRRSLGIPTIVLTAHAEEHCILRAFQAGVAGYLLKSQAASDLVQAIYEVAHGNTCLSPEISKVVIHNMLDRDSIEAATLTPREQEVLRLIAEGKSSKEVAHHLKISLGTSRTYRARLMEKLNIHQVAGLVRYAVREGLLQP